MPAPRMMRSRDIAAYLGVSMTQARGLMLVLEQNGSVIKTTKKVTAAEKLKGRSKERSGKAMKLVDAKVFARWLCDQDHADYDDRLHDLQCFLVETHKAGATI